MRFTCALSTAACLLWTSSVHAQSYAQDGPTLLPVPRTAPAPNAYRSGPPAAQYRASQPTPAARANVPTQNRQPAAPGFQAPNQSYAPPRQNYQTQGPYDPAPGPNYPQGQVYQPPVQFDPPEQNYGNPRQAYGPSPFYANSNPSYDAPGYAQPMPGYAPAGYTSQAPGPGYGGEETLPPPTPNWGPPAAAAPGAGPNGNLAPIPTDPYQEALCSGCNDVVGLPWGGTCRPNAWFGSGAGIIMTRDNPNGFATSFSVLNPAAPVLTTQQAAINWQGGGQVMLGRWFGGGGACGAPRCGIQGVYWALAPMHAFASVRDDGNNLTTPFNLAFISFGPGGATGFFDGAHEQRIWRTDSIQNVEVNLLQRAMFFDSAPRLMVTGLAGARWFHFSDNVIFGSVAAGSNFGDAGGANEAYLNNKVINNLVGGQIGARLDYFTTPRLRFFAAPTLGVFGNRLTSTSQMYTGSGVQAFNNFPLGPSPYNYRTIGNTVSLLGQIDVGAGWQITPRLSAFISYRAVAVSRVGQADQQFTPLLSNGGFNRVQTNGDLILHGAVAGGQWNF